jgi:hypothetical protein
LILLILLCNGAVSLYSKIFSPGISSQGDESQNLNKKNFEEAPFYPYFLKLKNMFSEQKTTNNQKINKKYYLINKYKDTINNSKSIQVEIIGGVLNPGKYEMKKGDQVFSLIQKAGGLSLNGVMPHKNYYLQDGMKFIVYFNRKVKERSNERRKNQ